MRHGEWQLLLAGVSSTVFLYPVCNKIHSAMMLNQMRPRESQSTQRSTAKIYENMNRANRLRIGTLLPSKEKCWSRFYCTWNVLVLHTRLPALLSRLEVVLVSCASSVFEFNTVSCFCIVSESEAGLKRLLSNIEYRLSGGELFKRFENSWSLITTDMKVSSQYFVRPFYRSSLPLQFVEYLVLYHQVQ